MKLSHADSIELYNYFIEELNQTVGNDFVNHLYKANNLIEACGWEDKAEILAFPSHKKRKVQVTVDEYAWPEPLIEEVNNNNVSIGIVEGNTIRLVYKV